MEKIADSSGCGKPMSLVKKNRQGVGRLLKQAYTLCFTFAILLFAGSAVSSPAQLPKIPAPEPKAEPAAPLDPLGRQTPRSSLINLMKYEASGDYATAARFLQLPPGENLEQLTREFRMLSPNFQGAINLLSDDPNGTVEPGLPLGQVRAGVVTVGGTSADMILVRVDDPVAGKIWLVSRGTVESVPKLYALLEREKPTEASRIRRALLSGPVILGMSSTQWLGWLLSIPLAWLASLAVDLFAERTEASLVQAPPPSFPHRLGYTSWHAAQVHDCHPAARRIRVLAGTSDFVPHLLCSSLGRPAGGLFRMAL